MKKNILSFIALILFASYSQQVNIPLPAEKALAFPGAEGFGKYTKGGRGGKVWTVTNLNDNGRGSLREAINATGPRIIVFAVSGTIALQSKLVIKNGDLTIAGQSAPGDGICLKNYTTTIDADNVIIRYLRFRLGDEAKQQDDAINGTHHHQNIIIDHCSMSWSVDECASFYRNRWFTLQWCLIAESLNHSVHEKGDHGYGGIWGGESATFHHNLLACNTSRNPRFSGSPTTINPDDELVDFRNNVIYNWRGNSTYGGEKGRYNMVNNYYKPGPATSKNVRSRIVNPTEPYGKFYIQGNVVEGDQQVTANNWKGGVQCNDPMATQATTAFPVEPLPTQEAGEAYALVLQQAGASLKRDAADARIIEAVRSGQAIAGRNGIIDSQKEAGGWPLLQSLPAPADIDKDGMPDEWEIAHQLNPQNNNDASAYILDLQYTNIEVYLNSLVNKKITIFLAGDSTISIKDPKFYPETGWGMPFVYFFDSTVAIENRAMNGRSTKSFINEGRWQKLIDDVQEGDYVLIQFGHNDEVKEKAGRYTTPDEFSHNLERFITETRNKKANPVLITPVSRRKFDAEDNQVQTHEAYSKLVIAVADDNKVPLIDLDSKSRALYQRFGNESSRWLFLQLQPGEHPNYPNGVEDNTHFNELGARLVAELVLADLKNLQPHLAARIVKRTQKK